MRLARYLVVGTVATAIDFGCLFLLEGHMPLLVANTIAFLVANVANFLLAHAWVFGQPFDGSIGAQYAKVFMVSLVGLALNDAVVWGGVVLLALPLFWSKVIATGVALAWNFMARARWVYRAENGA